MLLLKWDLALRSSRAGCCHWRSTDGRQPLRTVGEYAGQRAGLSERLSDLLAGFQVVRTFSLGGWILGRFGHGKIRLCSTPA